MESRVLVYGDIHLYSKNYGSHIDYAKESIEYFELITDVAKEYEVTHVVGLGDFSYGRFNSLEYRLNVERLLEEQNKITNGNRYELRGNHDTATYGMTEYEYYVSRGILKGKANLKLGCANISMCDYNDYSSLYVDKDSKVNILLAHDFLKFKNTTIANYGKAIELDNDERFYGLDYIISGHIHNIHIFEGDIIKDGNAHRCIVHYPGALTRPSIKEGLNNSKGNLVLLRIDDEGFKYDVIEVDLKPLNETYIMTSNNILDLGKATGNKVDIVDIVKNINNFDNNIGNPEDIIMNLEGINEVYKNKAIDLLKKAE
ncbi:MAG: metallophosphoesterase [Candidatus Anstonellales archaeon]